MARTATEHPQPTITRDRRTQTVELNGRMTEVEEIVYLDYGPNHGVTKVFIRPSETGERVDYAGIDKILSKYGLRLNMEATLAAGRKFEEERRRRAQEARRGCAPGTGTAGEQRACPAGQAG